jgi:ribosomal protein S18 acetylase RimI-like enzyme
MSASPVKIAELHQADISAASDVMARAFSKSLSGLYYICEVEKDGFENRLEKYFQISNRIHIIEDQPILGIYTQNRLVGVAVINEPLHRRTILMKLYFLTQLLIATSFQTVCRYLKYTKLLSKSIPKTPHFYIGRLAIDPSFQRLGYGKALLNMIHQRSENDKKSIGVVLETANPQNVRYYCSLGYKTICEVDLPIVETVMVRHNASYKCGDC